MTDPLAEQKAERAKAHIDWFVAEVGRLQAELVEQSRMLRIAYGDPALIADGALAEVAHLKGLLGRLEWIVFNEQTGEARCPVCRLLYSTHASDCWLAATLTPTDDPPEGERP